MTDMENESPSDAAFLPDSAREALSSWVDAGGVMVMTGTYGDADTNFLNLVFGWDLATTGGSSWAKNTAGTTGTPFDALEVPSLPNLSATDSIGTGTVPGFTPLWRPPDNPPLAPIPHNIGRPSGGE